MIGSATFSDPERILWRTRSLNRLWKWMRNFAENLLEKLVAAGFSGEELVAKFKEVKQMVLNGQKPYL